MFKQSQYTVNTVNSQEGILALDMKGGILDKVLIL